MGLVFGKDKKTKIVVDSVIGEFMDDGRTDIIVEVVADTKGGQGAIRRIMQYHLE